MEKEMDILGDGWGTFQFKVTVVDKLSELK